MIQKSKRAHFQIRVEGVLNNSWSEWLNGLSIEYTPDGQTKITSEVRDQAELFGILIKVRDFGLELVSVNRAEEDARKDGSDSSVRSEHGK